MKKKHIAILFLLVLIPFIYYSLRSDLIGYDGYYYLNGICGKDEFRNEPPLSLIIFSMLPCSIFYAKVLLFLSCFVSALFLAFSGGLYNKKHGWKAGFLAFLSGVFFFEFMKFENDQIAYPLIFIATYFFFKSFQEGAKRGINQLICAGILIVAALIWPGTLIYLLILALTPLTLYLKVIIFPLLIPFGYGLLSAVIGHKGVLENVPFKAKFLGPLPIGMINWIGRNELLIPGCLSVILAIINPKFAIFAVPFMTMGIVIFFREKKFWNIFITYMLQIVAIIFILFSFLFILPQPPTEMEHQAVQFAIAAAETDDGNLVIKNDWDLGHLIKWHGGRPAVLGGNFWMEDYNRGGIALTRADLNCTILGEFDDRRIYQC